MKTQLEEMPLDGPKGTLIHSGSGNGNCELPLYLKKTMQHGCTADVSSQVLVMCGWGLHIHG